MIPLASSIFLAIVFAFLYLRERSKAKLPTRLSIEVHNSKMTPKLVQVDPFACLYKLEEGTSIEFGFETISKASRIAIDEYNNHELILTIDSDGFYVTHDGKQVPWTSYPSNL